MRINLKRNFCPKSFNENRSLCKEVNQNISNGDYTSSPNSAYKSMNRYRSNSLVRNRMILKKLASCDDPSLNPSKTTQGCQTNDLDAESHEAVHFKFSTIACFAVIPVLYFIFFLILCSVCQ